MGHGPWAMRRSLQTSCAVQLCLLSIAHAPKESETMSDEACDQFTEKILQCRTSLNKALEVVASSLKPPKSDPVVADL
eukprot:15464813-Alexandrium_andersonii.AAC.1